MTLTFKILFTVFALINWAGKIHATNYYVNATTGNNSNTGLSVDKAVFSSGKKVVVNFSDDDVEIDGQLLNGKYLYHMNKLILYFECREAIEGVTARKAAEKMTKEQIQECIICLIL